MPAKNNSYQICIRCVMDTTDPDIVFDESGVCNHCHLYDRTIAGLPKAHEAQSQLKRIVEKIKKNGEGKEYDCVIGLSGGVDSTYVAYLVKSELGLRPLAVHLDNGWNSELSVKNIENIVSKLNIDLFTYVINWEEFRDIQLSFLKASTPDSEVPTDHAIFSVLRKVAKKNRLKYVINGINIKTESHHPNSWSQGHSDWKYIREIQKRFGTEKIKTFPHGNFFTIFEDRVSSRWINILNYTDYNKEKAKEIISHELDWKDYGGKHFESIYTRFYQGYILPKKFGYDKRRMHLSSLICSQEITRQEALQELTNEPYPKELQEEDKEYVIKKLGINEEEFESIMQNKSKSYYDYPSYYGTLLKSKFYKNAVSIIKSFLGKNDG